MTEHRAQSGRRRIVVLAPNWLGDAVMASPLLSRLRAADGPDAGAGLEILLGVRPAWRPLFERDPRLDGTFPIERKGVHRGLGGLWRLGRDLRALDAAAVLLGPPSLRAGLAAALAGIPLRVGYRADGRGPLLTRGLPTPPRGSLHYTHEMLQLADELLAGLGIVAGQDEPGAGGADDWLPGCGDWPAADAGEGPPLWAVAPGTTFGPAKTWPAVRLSEFLRSAVTERGRRVVLLGDGASAGLCAELESRTRLPWRHGLPGPAGVIDLTGRTDLPQVVALLKAAEGFVGNDSGLMHLAGALNVATVGIFGSSNPDWTAPAGPRTCVAVADGFECRPCYRATCNQSQFCLEQITADRVLADLEQLIRRGESESGESKKGSE